MNTLIRIVAAVALGVSAMVATGQPLAHVDVDFGCVQTMNFQPIYSGTIALYGWEWGLAGADVVSSRGYHFNGVGKQQAPFCAPALPVVGDCWQSVTGIAATPGAPKWVIAAGASEQCHRVPTGDARGLQVWKWNGSAFAWVGLIPSSILMRSGAGFQYPTLDGDFAWAKEVGGGWSQFDLNAKVVTTTGQPEPATPSLQSSVQGYTYTIHSVDPTPIPNPYPGPHRFFLERAGGPVASVTRAPSVTPVPTQPAVACTPGITRITVVITASPTRTKTKTPTKTPVPCPGCTPRPTPNIGPNS